MAITKKFYIIRTKNPSFLPPKTNPQQTLT